ncbi:unnamed protein product [Mytilus edulis]|uniref:Uncharacterized protein n=1 Tax=Mytilus edulis TaxID=6550 RepID=A0A8S3TYE4_MYTED|nr:unnamed protein product [Mytilus edulis]
MNISCQATDDLGKLSNMSKNITLDPYYGPDSVLLKPGHKAINVTEGTTLGPIIYSPNITSFWIGDDQNPTTHRYLEGTNPRITLRIDSNPDLRLTLNSSLFIVSPLEFTKQSKDFSTNLPSLKCENSGNFTIQARNGIAYGDNRTVNLIILCKPRDVKTERQIGAKVNNDVNIVMDVISFPAPNATWLRVTPFIWTVHKDQHNYRYKISSTMKITSEDAFGEHGIKICNTLGCIVENITFKPEDFPLLPRDKDLQYNISELKP